MTLEVRERRTAPTTFEARSGAEGSAGGSFTGHAAVFGARSEYMRDRWGYGWYEQVDRGFFDGALGVSDIRCLKNHDPNLILGRSAPGRMNNTLTVGVDERGLLYRCDVGDTTAARDLAIEMTRGDITQSSWSFSIAEESWGETKEGVPLRTLMRAAAIFDVSPVTFPAYPDADSGLRSGLSHLAESRSIDVEELLGACKAGELGKVIGRSAQSTVIDLAAQRRSLTEGQARANADRLRALDL